MNISLLLSTYLFDICVRHPFNYKNTSDNKKRGREKDRQTLCMPRKDWENKLIET